MYKKCKQNYNQNKENMGNIAPMQMTELIYWFHTNLQENYKQPQLSKSRTRIDSLLKMKQIP